jgi:hypothetical protein
MQFQKSVYVDSQPQIDAPGKEMSCRATEWNGAAEVEAKMGAI